MMGFIFKKVVVSVRLFAIEKYAGTSIRCLEITLSLKEKSKKLNKKLLTCSILSFSDFKLLSLFNHATLQFTFFARRPKGLRQTSSIYYCHFFVLFLSTELQPFFMHNKCVLIFLLTFDLVSFFPLCLKRRLQIHQSFLF